MVLAALLIAALLGYYGVRLWLPASGGPWPWTQALHASLGTGLGIGLTAWLHFLLVAGGAGRLPVILGVEFLALCLTGAMLIRRRGDSTSGGATSALPQFPWNGVSALGLAGMLCLLLAGFVNNSAANPQGGWDAFAIWNLRARFLLHTETWKYAVTSLPVGTHMEYPLLLSSAIARGWAYSGSVSPVVPIATALVFAVALVVLLVAALSLARGVSLGLLAGVVLLANPALLTQTSQQYADVPLAFFFLGATGLVVLAGESPGKGRYLSLAGVFAGFAAWTKNEGVMLALALAAALFAGAWRSAGWRSAARQTGQFLLGALPGLLVAFWFKAALAPPDPLAVQVGVNLGQRLTDGSRWLHAVGGFLKQAWELYIFPGPALALLAVVCGLLRLRPRKELYATPVLAVLLGLGGYFATLLASSYNLDWLFATAIDRLYLQVWPALVLAVFLLLRRPEDFAIASTGASAAKAAKTKKGR